MSNLYLIRHGRTRANEQHLYCGSTDVPLSDGGRMALHQMHYDIPSARYITSGMLRTEQTLEALFGDVPHTQDPEFREINFGVFEMHRYEQLKDRQDYQTWITGDNDANVPPKGESGVAMTARVVAAAERLLREPDENIVVITHGGVISAIMAHLFPEEGKSRYQWQPRPGFGYAIEDGTFRPIP